MGVGRTLSRIRLIVAIGLCGLSLANDVRAGRSLIRVGEIRTPNTDARLAPKLRTLLTKEIERLPLRSSLPEPYILSASLVRVDARRAADTSRATCVVSTTLRREKGGTLVAMTRGSGTAEDDADALQEAVEQALEAAVHGAVVRVPEAF